MDPNEDIAEERLLRVIEGGGAIEPEAPKSPKKKNKSAGKNPLQKMTDSIGGFTSAIGRARSLRLDLHFTNTALWIVLALIGVYLIIDFVTFEFYTKPNYALNVAKPKKSLGIGNEESADSKTKMKPISDYLNAFQDRDPFTGVKQQEEVKEEPVEAPKTDPTSLTQGLTLVGINKGAQPEAFIEDTVQKKTYFVKAGQKVKDLLVKEVQADGVIFTFEDQEVKLSS